MTNVVKREEEVRIAVWFDQPRACICFADLVDIHGEPGEAITEEKIIRVPLVDGEDFIEAVINAARPEPQFRRIMDAVQALLDRRAVQAVNLAERLRVARRGERSRVNGPIPPRS